MPVITLTILKIIFLVLLYLFLFWSFRSVGRTIRDTHQEGGGAATALAKIPHFEIVAPESHRGTTVPISDGMAIGRDDNTALQLQDQYVSGTHAKVFARGGDFFIEDAGSTNGTLVNRKVIDGPTRIRRGDTVQIGRTVMEVSR